MTAETDLLPLPEWDGDFMTESEFREQAQSYARANLAELQREVEGLRAEVERLMTIAGWGGLAGDAPDRLILASEMFDGIACCDKWLTVRRIGDGDQPFPESATAYVRADIAEQAEARAERLEEALRHLRNHTSVNSHKIELIDAALRPTAAQEKDRG